MKNIFIVFILLIFSTTTIADLTGTEGLAIDLSSAGAGTDFTIAFDPTELLGSRTWGDGSTDTIVWTWDRATGTDPTITFNSGSFLLPALTLTTDLAVAHGGTGVSTLGDGFVLLGNAAGAIQALDVTTDGGIIIGDGTTDPVVLDVGSSTGITILGTIATGVWQGTAIADDYIPNTITIDTATVGTTVTITDNEDTAENNPIVFVAGGDLDGGNLGLESDGTTYYTPSTGTITTAEFIGGGVGLTALNGENITDDTIDNDSIDWGDMTDLGTDGVVTWGNIAEGELADSTVISADIKDGVVTEADLNASNAPGAGEDNYVLTYNHAGTNFTWAVDATGGNTAWDDITDPDAASIVDFGAHITQLDVNDFRVGEVDAGNYTKWLDGAMSFVGTGDIDLPNDSVDDADINWGNITNLGEAGTITVADTADATSFVALWESATGDLAAKSDLGLTYAADTGILTATGFAGPITGAVTGNADTATLATTVTITNNEDTAENNPLVFVAGGDLDGGNLGLESDGTTYYTPSTGKITATGFVGALTGNADTVTNATLTTALTVDTGTLTLTANAANNSVLTIGAGAVSVSGTNTGDNTDAETGDSATAFFDAGTIEHEWGGLQADVSGYTGLVAITGADTTAEIDSLDELEGQLADVTRIVSEAVMPVASADPDVDAAGELSIDTDGANEPNDVILRSMDGNYTQVAVAQSLKSIQGTVITPNSLADATRDACPIWENNTGMTFTITMIRAWSDTDNTTLNVETVDSDWDNNATVDAIEIATDEVANYSTEETTITAATITAGSLIVLDFDDTDAPGWVKFNIMGFFNSDVD